jgi:hypothetical protein
LLQAVSSHGSVTRALDSVSPGDAERLQPPDKSRTHRSLGSVSALAADSTVYDYESATGVSRVAASGMPAEQSRKREGSLWVAPTNAVGVYGAVVRQVKETLERGEAPPDLFDAVS